MMIDTPLPLLSRKQVRELVGLSYAHTARLEKKGKFPKRMRLTEYKRGRCAYYAHEIAAWIRERAGHR
jgi:predicted DNA-binding transcriptional regulator AlpA